ncbi:hypothetical protein M0811_07840 [Anaeramoeba ignava]|uniref:GAE domain-containing protein n=1 Tax=Anaeramoeba ignava TaxID=1746090 RepID=A0A9Q0LL21_ANAIG|nr:hypothetical protein M0811_07840 [Anaeramoeba ignava]
MNENQLKIPVQDPYEQLHKQFDKKNPNQKSKTKQEQNPTTNQGNSQQSIPSMIGLKMSQPSGSIVPANQSGFINQVVQVVNEFYGQNPSVIRVRFEYIINGSQKIQQADITQLPFGV